MYLILFWGKKHSSTGVRKHWSWSCSRRGSPIRTENNLYFISIIFRKLTWTPGVAKWPAVLGNAWNHCNPRSTVQGSPNETLWTLIQRCESKEVSQWLAAQALLIVFFFITAFCFPGQLFILVVPCFWQFFKCLPKELWKPGRKNQGELKKVSILKWRELRK